MWVLLNPMMRIDVYKRQGMEKPVFLFFKDFLQPLDQIVLIHRLGQIIGHMEPQRPFQIFLIFISADNDVFAGAVRRKPFQDVYKRQALPSGL